MNFNFENLGPIKSGSINIKDLTIICGENNTGKTYISYALYGFYKLFDKYFKDNINPDEYIREVPNTKNFEIDLNKLYQDIDNIRTKALNQYKLEIYRVFNCPKELFNNLKLGVEFENKYKNKEKFFEAYEEGFKEFASLLYEKVIVSRENEILRITDLEINIDSENLKFNEMIGLLLKLGFPNKVKDDVFMLPAERSGINIFFKELNVNRNNEIYGLNARVKMKSFIRNISKYSLPISDYINFLNEMKESENQEAEFKMLTNELEDNVIGGKYIINKDNTIRFCHKNFKNDESIDFHIASSTAKTLFSLDYYLKHNAEKGDILIIDEPELNLHPDNQRKLTRLLAKVVNKGIKVIISTHSDYIIKEINNLIVLARKFDGYREIMSKYNYKEDELISQDKISAHMLNDNSIVEAEISEEGIVMETFDDVINSYNESSDDIYYSYIDSIEE